MATEASCPNPVLRAAALVGLLVVLETAVWTDALPRQLIEKVRGRLAHEGLLEDRAGDRELRQAVNDLNHRLRYALGEYDERPQPLPVPE